MLFCVFLICKKSYLLKLKAEVDNSRDIVEY